MRIYFRQFLLFLFFLGIFAPSSQAALWVAAGVPAGFTWTSSGSGAYSHDIYASTAPTGTSIQVKIPGLMPLGYSQLTIPVTSLASTTTDTYTSSLKLDLMEVWWDFSPDSFNFLLGYGWGYGKFICNASDCADMSFEYKESHQYSGQLGVPFGGADFHLTASQIFARVRVVHGAIAENQDFRGLMTGFGVRIGF